MADRYGRHEDPYRSERGRHDERGFTDRARDEVRSWFGDDAADRRREMDERERERERERWRSDEYRPRERDYRTHEYDRTGDVYRGWNEPRYGYRGSEGYGYGGHASTREPAHDTGWSGPFWTANWTGDPSDRPRRWQDSRYSEWTSPVMGPTWAGREPGPNYTGRGPKGYQRSDDRIREDVCDRLCDAPFLDAGDMEVNVRQGEVTLTGTVRSRDDKRAAEDLADHVSGVREVHNNLRVNRGAETPESATGRAVTPATPGSRK